MHSDRRGAALRFSAEEKDQFDDQYDHDHKLKYECPPLVELVHHKFVQILRRANFLLDQAFIIQHTHFVGRQPLEARGEHVT